MYGIKCTFFLCLFIIYTTPTYAVTKTASQNGIHAIYEYDDPEQMYAINTITLDTSSYNPMDTNSNVTISLAIMPNPSTHHWSGTSNQSSPRSIYTVYSGCKALTGVSTTVLHEHCSSRSGTVDVPDQSTQTVNIAYTYRGQDITVSPSVFTRNVIGAGQAAYDGQFSYRIDNNITGTRIPVEARLSLKRDNACWYSNLSSLIELGSLTVGELTDATLTQKSECLTDIAREISYTLISANNAANLTLHKNGASSGVPLPTTVTETNTSTADKLRFTAINPGPVEIILQATVRIP
ncbi:MAG: hypothetical protein ACRC53_01510 [Plesiomonas sp.]|uniref:hypothetical protein n=1 Tax=Plesiomonas sp. TaxID=2486279 RepID=UPI003F361A17